MLMLTEPQTVTVAAVAKSLPRVAFGDRKGVFENTTTGHRLTVSHVNGKRNRSSVRLDITKTAADPLLDGVSRQYGQTITLAIDSPPVGFSVVETEANAQALVDLLDGAGYLTKIVGGES